MTIHQAGVVLVVLMLAGAAVAGAVVIVADFWRKGGEDLARALNQAARDGEQYGRRDR